MSALTNKNVLVVGNENTLILSVEESLEAHGATITKTTCEKVDTKLIDEKHTDLIILNYLEPSEDCSKTLELIRGPLMEKAIPVFALVEDSAEMIQTVLSLGVADYFTASEDSHTIVAKIKAVFGQEGVFGAGVAIDITPTEATISSTGIRVFVVEDDPLLRNLLSIKMDKSLFPCEFSADGINVLPAMRQFKPDVIILDLMLPGRSGFEVLSEVKADDKLRDVPVIVFSNRDGHEDRQKASELGASGFYVKAMTDLSELVETIESLVR